MPVQDDRGEGQDAPGPREHLGTWKTDGPQGSRQASAPCGITPALGLGPRSRWRGQPPRPACGEGSAVEGFHKPRGCPLMPMGERPSLSLPPGKLRHSVADEHPPGGLQ